MVFSSIASLFTGSLFGGEVRDSTSRNIERVRDTEQDFQSDLLTRLNASRNRLTALNNQNTTFDRFNEDLGRVGADIDSAASRLRAQRGALDFLPGALRRSTIADTTGARVDALNSARRSVGSRGTAFGLQSAALGARAGQQAATQQSAALANNLVNAQSQVAQFNMQQAIAEQNIAAQRQNLAQLRLSGAGLQEQRLNRLGQLEFTGLQMQQQLANQAQAGVNSLAGAEVVGISNLANIGAQGFIGGISNFESALFNGAAQGALGPQPLSGGGGGLGGAV